MNFSWISCTEQWVELINIGSHYTWQRATRTRSGIVVGRALGRVDELVGFMEVTAAEVAHGTSGPVLGARYVSTAHHKLKDCMEQ